MEATPPRNRSTPIGTLMKKSQRQDRRSVRTPPRTAPEAKPSDREGSVESQSLVAQRSFLERRGDQGETGGRDDRRGESLGGTGDEHDLGGFRETADRGRDGEQSQSGKEQPPASEGVPDPAEEQHEPRCHEGERGDDPLQAVDAETEVVTDLRKRDGQDGEVDGGHELCAEKDRGSGLLPTGHAWGPVRGAVDVDMPRALTGVARPTSVCSSWCCRQQDPGARSVLRGNGGPGSADVGGVACPRWTVLGVHRGHAVGG